MKQREFVSWYDLSLKTREELRKFGNEFEDLRHSGVWWSKGVCVYMDAIYPTMRFRLASITYDYHMPRIKSLMDRDIKIQIRAVNFNTLELDFIFPIPSDNSVPPDISADLSPGDRIEPDHYLDVHGGVD